MILKTDETITALLPDMNGEGIDESGREIQLKAGEYKILQITVDGVHILDEDEMNWIVPTN